MKKEKYYYGEDLRKVYMGVVVDSHNNIIQVNEKFGLITLPRVTICGIYDNEEQTLSFGVAKCAEGDEFNKKLGQRITYARALNKPYRVVQIKPEDKISKLFITNAKDIEQEVLKNYKK
jgi:hypothetical protein